MGKISNKSMIAGVLMATMGATSVFAMDNEFQDGYYFGGSLGKAISRTKPTGTVDILRDATFVPNAGASFEIKYKNADVFGFFGGYKKDDMRYEVGFRASKHKFANLNEHLANGTVQDIINFVEEAHIKYRAIDVNFYKDFSVSSWVAPYLGAGLGVARLESVTESIGALNPRATIKNTKPTAQLIAGARVPITDGFHLAADYRYWSTLGKVGAIDKRFSNHSINLGFLFQPRFL